METLEGLYIAFCGIAISGWFMNLFEVFGSHGNELMLRIIGIFVAPAGAIMGWFM